MTGRLLNLGGELPWPGLYTHWPALGPHQYGHALAPIAPFYTCISLFLLTGWTGCTQAQTLPGGWGAHCTVQAVHGALALNAVDKWAAFPRAHTSGARPD